MSLSWADIDEQEFAVDTVTKYMVKANVSYADVVNSINNNGFIEITKEPEQEQEDEDDDPSFTKVVKKSKVKKWLNETKFKPRPNDEKIICKECKKSFIFKYETKELYKSRNWKTPRICKPCAQIRHDNKQ